MSELPPPDFFHRLTSGRREATAEAFRALMNPDRIDILEVLSLAPKRFADLRQELNLRSNTLAERLRVLLDARLVTRGRHGRAVVYAIAPRVVGSYARLLAVLWERAGGAHNAMPPATPPLRPSRRGAARPSR